VAANGDSLDLPVLARAHAGVLADPDDALDGAVVRRGRAVGEEHVRLRARAREVEDAHLLLLPAREDVRRAGRDRDGADDVVVREGVQDLARVRVPDFAVCVRVRVCVRHGAARRSGGRGRGRERVGAIGRGGDSRGEIGAGRDGARRVGRELGAPHGALVADEGADPVAGPLAQHRVAVLAARDEQVRAVVEDRREGEVRDGARVPRRDERRRFDGGHGDRGACVGVCGCGLRWSRRGNGWVN
jgi:hypothetical protein